MVRIRAALMSSLGLVGLVSLGCGGGDDGASSATEGSGGSTADASGTSGTSGTSGGSTSGTGAESTSTSTSGASSGDTSTTGPGVELAEVGHRRELRGVWVASVFNINFPSEPGLDAATQEEELVGILDTMEAVGLNALFLQIRPECDALYPSDLEPWSRSLTGTQGGDPGWDPLAFAVEEAHLRGIEVHAWLNPYRARASKGSQIAPPHVALEFPEHAHDYDKYTWMDPGAMAVQDHLLAVIEDVVSRYAVDGIHFDDYFYPYPDGSEFPDDLTWDAYVQGGGPLTRDDWRRSNVDHMVESVGALVAEIDPQVRFGVSPFGIYRPGIPEGISGFDQYEGLFADPLRWLDEGWVDYLAPQLYWPTTYPKQAYDVLVAWWASVTTGGRHIFAGNYLSKLGTAPEWSLEEFKAQVELTRAQADAGARGNIFFTIEPFQGDWEGVASSFASEFYATPVLTPPIAALAGTTVAPPSVTIDGMAATVEHEDAAGLRAWVVYGQGEDGWSLERIVPASTGSVELSPGTWAISAAGRSGVESLGVVVTVR